VIAVTLWVIKDPRHIWENAAMKTLARILRLFNLGSGAHRRRVGECQAGARSLGGAEGASHALKTAYWILTVVLALSSSWVHAQTPTCAHPGCNSVTSDSSDNTAVGTAAFGLKSIRSPRLGKHGLGGARAQSQHYRRRQHRLRSLRPLLQHYRRRQHRLGARRALLQYRRRR
jgi:hypothetical protein